MASLNLAGKTSGYVKLQAPDDSSNNPTVTLPTESGELALKSDIGEGGGGSGGEATGTPSSFARIVDEKPQNTHGGTAVAGNQDRTLNKIEYDPDNIVTLSNDKEFTLQAGTYVINFSAPAYRTEQHNASLFSVTDNKKVLQGTAEYSVSSSSTASTHSIGRYSVTLTAPHTYKILHYTRNEAITDGLGIQAISGDSVFTTVDIEKVGTGGASSGGGDYTPENFVWEDVKADRVLNKKYTNTNDVPLYVQIFANSTTSYLNLYIDDVRVGAQGGSVTGGNVVSTNLYIVPSGSTYEAKGENGFVVTDIKQWHEARMPVAVGTGDSATLESLGIANHDSMIVNSSGDVNFVREMFAPNLSTTTSTPNCFIDTNGSIQKSTATSYTAEEVDKKLAIKDKLIEKLSERLDKLEKKLKK